MNIQKLVQEKRVKDIYILARYMYRIGKPFLDDKLFDTYEKFLLANNLIDKDLVNRSYDDDPVPYDLLRELNLEKFIISLGTDSPYAKYLDEEKSLSIQPLINYRDIYEYCLNHRGLELIVSLKVDGINCKSLYMYGDFMLSLSRARSGNGIDYTKNLSKVIPTHTDMEEREVKIFSESFVEPAYLDTLKSKYDANSYKTCRTSATSLLRVSHSTEDYEHLHTLVFNAEGLKFATISATLEYLESKGFEVVPHMVLEPNTIPKDYNEFKKFIKSLCDKFAKETLGIPSDGIVIDVNDLSFNGVVNGKYSNRNIAIKIEQWGFNYYKGIIKSIILEQKAVNASCRVEIEPMKTSDGCDAKIVNVHNPRILIDNGYKVGSEIYYERQSGTINTLLYGDKLKKILNDNE